MLGRRTGGACALLVAGLQQSAVHCTHHWMRRGMAGRGGTGGSWERSELFAGVSWQSQAHRRGQGRRRGPATPRCTALFDLVMATQSSAAAAAGRGDMEEDAAVRAMREENDALTRDLESKADLMSRSATRINHEVRDSMALLQSVVSGPLCALGRSLGACVPRWGASC